MGGDKPPMGRSDRASLVLRLLLILVTVPPTYWLLYRFTTTLFSLYGIAWMPHTIALLVSAELAWIIWTRIGIPAPGRDK